MSDSAVVYFLTCVSLAIIAFSVHLLLLRSTKQAVYLPLAGCLAAIAVLICQPVLKELAPSLQVLFLLLALPALYLIPPCFWLYVQGITSSTKWQLGRTHLKHFVLSGAGLCIVIGALLLPGELRHAILVDGDEAMLASTTSMVRYIVYGLLIITFILVLGWIVQAGFYVYVVYRRLNSYRAQLRELFASTEAQEGRWILWILLAVGGVWLFAAGTLLYDNLVAPVQTDAVLRNLVILVMIWSVAIWGLRQKPGFEELYQSNSETQEVLKSITEHKYQRSALNAQLADSIVTRLTYAMEYDRLFLDASLSLPKLAKHISRSAYHISQTLNETMGVNFFDYVNRYRVNAAKEQLKNTDDTVLDIAMNAGFNAKSSFYTAFKKETGVTPNQYRKAERTKS
ncbi:MAG: AraC family transcriptional regulator [Pseudohongiella sp.]|uniref:helix-turn-helix domain-containing protein n=1 Tax=Pseudohongiella sp. TaxID=1979412 RepID=UPI0034A071AD